MITPDTAFVTIQGMRNTIQGSGILTGSPVTRISFSGCSIKSCFNGKCNTHWRNGRALSVNAAIDSIKALHPHNHFVLGGGEPLDQKYLIMFLVELSNAFRGALIQVETATTKRLADHMVRAVSSFYSDKLAYIYKFEEYFPIFFSCSPKVASDNFKDDLYHALYLFRLFGQGELDIVWDPEEMTVSQLAKTLDDPKVEKTCYEKGIHRYLSLEDKFLSTLVSEGRLTDVIKSIYSFNSLSKFKISPKITSFLNVR